MKPILEYCSNLWNPFRKSEIDLIESVQKRFTKRLYGMAGLQYAERLKILGAESLELRRFKSDLYMYYKIVFEMIDLPIDEFFSFRHGITRNNGFCMHQNIFRSNAERYYFKNRVISSWNSLSSNVVNSASPLIFKSNLAGMDLRKFLRTCYD